MHPKQQLDLKTRVIHAAEAALADHQFVSPIDILTGTRLLEPAHVESWKKGRIDFLEGTIQANPNKVSQALDLFRQWALDNRLKPSETRYVRASRAGTADLRFTIDGDPAIERNYRTHYVSPTLSERKQEQLTQKLSRPAPPVVFAITRGSACSECAAELEQGSFLFMDAGQALCLPCARMDDLEFLPCGDTALTRRSVRYSERSAVVVRFSRSRGRYERQGVLVEKPALETAEQECSEDAPERAKARVAGAARREDEDRELIARMTVEIRELFPRCPPEEAAAIAAHTATRNSGRVGRSAAGRSLDKRALTAAVVAAVRHKHTPYDALLASGVDRLAARSRVAEGVDATLDAWRE